MGYTMCLLVEQDAERRDLPARTRVGTKKTHSITYLPTTNAYINSLFIDNLPHIFLSPFYQQPMRIINSLFIDNLPPTFLSPFYQQPMRIISNLFITNRSNIRRLPIESLRILTNLLFNFMSNQVEHPNFFQAFIFK